MLEIVPLNLPNNCGDRSRQYTVSVQFVTQTFGRQKNKCYQVNAIVQLVKIAVRRVILNDSTTLYANEFHA